MPFTSKRGRPALKRPEKDKGTPELIAKRRQGLTDEPLDYLLKQNLITSDQHWAGIHFRWLYTIVFGIPNISVKYLNEVGFADTTQRSEEWRRRREKEYGKISEILVKNGCKNVLIDLCIHSKSVERKQVALYKKSLDLLIEIFSKN